MKCIVSCRWASVAEDRIAGAEAEQAQAAETERKRAKDAAVRRRQRGSSGTSGRSDPSGSGNGSTAGDGGGEENVSYEPNAAKREEVRRILGADDYYQIFGLEKGTAVTETMLKPRYRKLSLKVHPDKNLDPRAKEAFDAVAKAYQCLSDDRKRRIYDQTGSDPDTADTGGGDFTPFDGADIFESVFGGGVFSTFDN